MTEFPTVTGPVTGGWHGWSFGGPIVPLDGYVQDEFIVEGASTRYRLPDSATMTLDGNWSAEPCGTAPFRTRIVVFRPADSAAFSGTVIVTWNNVTAGYDICDIVDSPEIRSGGDAVVAVTAQRVGVHGTPGSELGLAVWDPERYGSLQIVGDDDSYDIFTQVARIVGPDRPATGVDPLGGLPVRNLIAHGSSQSAGRLATYINALHQRTRVFDGYLLQIYMGFGLPLQVGDYVIDLTGPGKNPGPELKAANRLRELDDARVMVVNSELEASVGLPVRQPDTDHYRCWEVAGACHTSVQGLAARGPKLARDFGTAGAGFLARAGSEPTDPSAHGPNRLPMAPVNDAALHHLRAWVDQGIPPPIQPRIEFGGDPAEIVRDEDGIARGGIRLPDVEVPVAVNGSKPMGEDLFAVLCGSCVPFTPGQVLARYGDREGYLDRYRSAAERAAVAGVLRPRDVARLVDEAAVRPFP